MIRVTLISSTTAKDITEATPKTKTRDLSHRSVIQSLKVPDKVQILMLGSLIWMDSSKFEETKCMQLNIALGIQTTME
jgi:hypothetical protein